MFKLIAGVLLLLVPALAMAQQQSMMPVVCGNTKAVVLALSKDYGEKMVWSAKEEDGVIITMWTNEAKQTFTILKTSPDGAQSCVISAGQLFPKA